MAYAREELDWLEAEWAYHLHGRSAFLSREDFAQLMVWSDRGVAADALVAAMEAYFERRARRPRPRSFVALSHLAKDVDKIVKLRESLRRAEPEGPPPAQGWESVEEPLRSDPRARRAFEAWRRLQAAAPLPDSPGFLEHFDAERQALGELVKRAEEVLGPGCEDLAGELRGRLLEAGLQEGSFVWKRAWEHHWGLMIRASWRIPC